MKSQIHFEICRIVPKEFLIPMKDLLPMDHLFQALPGLKVKITFIVMKLHVFALFCKYPDVADVKHGEGIQGDKLEQVFVPFFTTRKEGSGIGLSLCRQIVRSHKGRMQIESEPEEGTRVIITL
jgi:hypothetical protein